jgi:cell division protein FtsW
VRFGRTQGNVRRKGRKSRAPSKSPAQSERTRSRPAQRSEQSAGPDGAVVASIAILAALGVVINYSATAALAMGEALPPLALRHMLGVSAALLAAAVAYRIPVALWRRAALPLWVCGVILLGATLVIGIEANGARRWLAIPGLPLALQPSEMARWATALAVSVVLARGIEERSAPVPPLRVVAGLAVAPVAFLLVQPDFGSAMVLLAVVGVVLFAAATPLRILLVPVAVSLAGAVLYVATHPYALARVRGVFDPWQNARSEGFQLVQSFVAFGRGGSLGMGLGDGRQKLFYLPEAHTDFVLSVIAEELGLLGVLVVLGCFATFAFAGLRIARRASDPFALLLATAMTGLVVVPAATNAAVVMGLLPTTGLTLPLLSHGSNSLLLTAIAVGTLLRIGAHEAPPAPSRVRGATPRGLVRT